MTQPTDEAAVAAQLSDALAAKNEDRFRAIAFVNRHTILSALGGLTAATRRAEQAERMLAEAVKALQPFAECIKFIEEDSDGEYVPGWSPFLKVDYYRAADATIHSAASGEQG